MEIHLDGHHVTTTMRTPGHDFELAAGFCHTEGLLHGEPVHTVRYCGNGSAADTEFNVVTVETDGRAPVPTPRLAPTTSSCGICGAEAVDDLRVRLTPVIAVTLDPAVAVEVVDDALAAQPLHASTGAVHAAASFDVAGTLGVVREDIGRHNAVDKVIGRLLLDGELPASGLGLYVSGRASFEMVQKAWAAGFGAVVSVSAPSALAVSVAQAAGLTLAGFVRDGSINVYTEPDT